MKLFHRILLAPLIAIVLMLFLGGVSYWAMSSQRQAMQRLVDVRFINATMAGDIRSGILAAHASAYRILTWGDTNGAKFTDQETKALLSNFDAVAGKFANWASRTDKEEADLAKQLVEKIEKYKKSVVAALDMASADHNAGVVAMQTADDNFKALNELTEKLVALERDIGSRDAESANKLFRNMLILSICTLVAAILLSAGIAVSVSRRISGQLGGEPDYAAKVAGQIADGDLTGTIAVHTGDQTSLLSAMARMQEALRKVVGQAHQASDKLVDAAHDLATVSNHVSQSSSSQTDAASAVAASIEEMSTSIAQVADSAGNARSMASEVGDMAAKSASLVGRTVDGIHQIAGSVEHASQVVHALGESSDKISGIVQTIKDIADQTNLLALNAAIEAARAGEQGRGFAVVADEVRKLAEKTGTSTQEISMMIASIQQGTADAVQSMQSGASQVTAGSQVASEAGSAMGQVEQSTQEVLTSIGEISTALDEQRSASELIARNVEKIAQMTEENSEGVSRLTLSANNLDQLAKGLKTTIGQFRL